MPSDSLEALHESTCLLMWAKMERAALGSQDTKDRPWHPLICHLIDVASVASAMWRDCLPERMRRRLADLLGVGADEAAPWTSLLSGLHDLGKATPGFQSKRTETMLTLGELGLRFPSGAKPAPHGILGTRILVDMFRGDEVWNLRGAGLQSIAAAVAGHHGIFARPDQWVYLASSQLGGHGWREQRQVLVRLLSELVVPPGDTLGETLVAPDPAALVLLAGLTSVADWIGSAEEFFPFRGPICLGELQGYRDCANDQADKALAETGWRFQPFGASRPVSFGRLFPGLQPRPPQEATDHLAARWRGPGLAIAEAPMGEGKTEAAWLLHRACFAATGGEGCYVALPTQATSNQMFSRVRDFLSSECEGERINLQLLHGHAGLSADFRHLHLAAIMDESEVTPGSATVVAEEWFTPKKRGLLAPYAVGTIDQALLAVLRAKHSFVRLFGLAGKTLVIDEVHAYDTYMSTLLDRLLEWAAAMGLSVVLLSATLPARRRQQLAEAYSGERIALPATPYPRLSWVDDRGVGAVTFAARSQSPLRLSFVGEDPAPIATSLAARLTNGGCAVWICNTVARAQGVYSYLRSLGLADATLGLFHARYPFAKRSDRERWVLGAFGRDGGTDGMERPHRAILVATQVVEQSLDLDFDLMVSDLAPIDLLLQRAGRLHRHERSRPPELVTPELWIVGPTYVGPGTDLRRTAPVYDEYILLRSWLALQGKEAIALPQDIECLVEAVYGEEGFSEELGAHFTHRLAKARAAGEAERLHERAEANKRVIPSPLQEDDLLEDLSGTLEDDAPELHKSLQALTRLSDPSVSVVFLHEVDGRVSLDCAGDEPIDLENTPGLELSTRLWGQSVSLSHRGVVRPLLDVPVPPGWSRSPLLRRHRALVLEQGAAEVGGFLIRLDPELGVVATKREEAELES